ncbi:MAG: polysulfide reductase NrfD [Candidatus Eremiobacteraeota bacterium]|nr:polysulfide reductase NrfD [Candidatus Eremiobacteraeota bacterium]
MFFTFLVSTGVVLIGGVGMWGINIPVGWGMAITNFVWWIGIGHAGTLISAFLLLMRQGWRDSINRFAEAMTLLAVVCAGVFPLLHLGRPWLFYYLAPYPNKMGLWPQWRSPLVWDMFAVATYFTVSLMFWYLGLVPDLAVMRDSTTGWKQKVYGVMALGWRGSAHHWVLHQRADLLLAAFATPLVLSVHSIVSLDFAVGIVPGWHSTIFPPYFVAGAILSGFAMVATLAIPLRRYYRLEDFITIRHLENMAKLMLLTSILVTYGYASEMFMAWYSHDPAETSTIHDWFFGPYAPIWYTMLVCNCTVPALFWWKRIRTWPAAIFIISLLVNLGMWLERYLIVINSLHHDFMSSAEGIYVPTVWDWGLLIGTLGLFLTFFMVFLRTLPSISIYEVSESEDEE